METCKNCLHYDICTFHVTGNENEKCTHYTPTADVVPKSEVEDAKIKAVAGVIAEIAERLKSKHNTFKTCASRLVGNEYASGRMEAYEEFIDILNEISKKNTDTSPADPKEAFIKKLVDNWKWGEEE